jgi:hypothetical protein
MFYLDQFFQNQFSFFIDKNQWYVACSLGSLKKQYWEQATSHLPKIQDIIKKRK